MAYETENEYKTSYYRCVDPIDNFKIKVTLKPVKSIIIPLPQFDIPHSSESNLESQDDYSEDIEEYTFCWQEKIFSGEEIQNHSKDSNWKKKMCEKYSIEIPIGSLKKNYPRKLFTFVDIDNYMLDKNYLNNFTVSPKSNNDVYISAKSRSRDTVKSRAKLVNYKPSDDFKNQNHKFCKNTQNMFIMANFGCNDDKPEQNLHLICALSYDSSTKLLEITPSFTKCDQNPYIIGVKDQDTTNAYYCWLNHVSESISSESLNKEINIMTKVVDHQEELRRLLIGTEFFMGQPDHLYVTLLMNIISAQNFEYDPLLIHYFVKLPPDWDCSNPDSLFGTTCLSKQNFKEVAYFSQLLEINLSTQYVSIEDFSASQLEIFLEVFSVDKFKRYRNEGYTFICVPSAPGIYEKKLQCWRASDRTIKSKLQRFFIGGGPELEDVSYVGLSNNQKGNLMSRYGFETIPSGSVTIKLQTMHQSEIFKSKKGHQPPLDKTIQSRSNMDSILSSVNAVLEAFRKARARMIEAKKGLDVTSGAVCGSGDHWTAVESMQEKL